MDGQRTRIVAVAILTASGLTMAGGWETVARGDVDAYLNSPQVGMNIAGLSDQSTQWTLSNYYLSTGENWYETGGTGVTIDSQGDPILNNASQSEGQNIYLQTAPSPDDTVDYPAGQWTVTWNGPVSMDISGDTVNASTGASQNYYWLGNNNTSVTNTETFNVAPGSNGLYLIEGYNTYATDPESATNVHVYAPGYAPGQANAGQMFTTQFTQGLQPFGTIRYMDAMNTNGDSTTWTSLPSQTTALANETWTGASGMPLAAMVSLANKTDTNPWFCMPANASDAYITQFAQYVKTNLDPNLKVYVEYANEDWSTLNPSGQRIEAQSGASEGVAFDQYWASDDAQVFKDWESVYAPSGGTSSQIVRVAAIQTSNTYDSPIFLSDLSKDGGFDAVADAPYFGPTSANIASYTSTTTAQQILNDMIANIQSQASATGDWTENMQLAKLYGVPLIGYEGGQGLTPGSTSVSWYQAYLEAEASPEMEQIYQLWLETYLNQVGASEVNAFSYVGEPGAYGAWGSMDYQGDPDAPKYDGLLDYITGVPEPATLGLFAPAAGLLLARRRRKSHG